MWGILVMIGLFWSGLFYGSNELVSFLSRYAVSSWRGVAEYNSFVRFVLDIVISIDNIFDLYFVFAFIVIPIHWVIFIKDWLKSGRSLTD